MFRAQQGVLRDNIDQINSETSVAATGPRAKTRALGQHANCQAGGTIPTPNLRRRSFLHNRCCETSERMDVATVLQHLSQYETHMAQAKRAQNRISNEQGFQVASLLVQMRRPLTDFSRLQATCLSLLVVFTLEPASTQVST